MNLTDAMRRHYSGAKFFLYICALPLSLLIYIAALAAAFPLDPWKAGALAVYVLRVVALDCIDVAENIRRIVMIKNGYGVDPSPAQFARLRERWD